MTHSTTAQSLSTASLVLTNTHMRAQAGVWTESASEVLGEKMRYVKVVFVLGQRREGAIERENEG